MENVDDSDGNNRIGKSSVSTPPAKERRKPFFKKVFKLLFTFKSRLILFFELKSLKTYLLMMWCLLCVL